MTCRARFNEAWARAVVPLATAALALGAGSAFGHHSFQATFDVNEEITLRGRLVQFMYRNPHSFVHVEVTAEDGATQRWSVEWSGSSALSRQGVERTTLRVGDEVVITAHPSRTPADFRAQMVTLRRPLDGLTWGERPGEVVD